MLLPPLVFDPPEFLSWYWPFLRTLQSREPCALSADKPSVVRPRDLIIALRSTPRNAPAAPRYRRALGNEPRRLTVRPERAIRRTSYPWPIGREADRRKSASFGQIQPVRSAPIAVAQGRLAVVRMQTFNRR
jgi:hypothetical protein